MIFYKKLNPIYAITFDLDDTLYENTSIIVQAERSLLDFMHDKYPVTKQLDKGFWRKQTKFHILTNPQLKNDMSALRRLSLQSGFKELGFSGNKLDIATQDCYQHFYFQRSNFSLNENIYSLLTTLSQKLPLIAITNGNVNLQQLGIDSLFVASFKANLTMPMKPDKAMFSAAQSFLNLPCKNILHVGDNLSKDIYGALKAGDQAAWYAEYRSMNLNHEKTQLLPHVQLSKLQQLLEII